MIDIKLVDIANAVGGKLFHCDGNELVNRVVIDSRKINTLVENSQVAKVMFIALKGDNVNGNDYAKSAIELGATVVLVSEVIADIPQIVVEDTAIALKKLSAYYRNFFNIPFIGVTGSTGKTSTKEMVATVLAEGFKVHKTMMNFNNEIGLPMTMLEIDHESQVSVLEMGMDKFGEIECLAEISRPDIGVITNIGTAHIENLGSRQNILKAKLEITKGFNENSMLVINCDDEYLSQIKETNYKVKRVSICGNGDYNAFEIQSDGESGVEFKCNYNGDLHNFRLSVPGKHNVYNALVAIAIAEKFEMQVEKVKAGIVNYRPVGQRMNIMELGGSIKLINDCYNANPDSMKAALDVLAEYKSKRRIAVLGDMYELGEYSEDAHKLIGNYLVGKCDMFVAVGESTIFMFNEAKNHINSTYFKTKEEASAYLISIIKENDVILVKASRGMKMEQLINSLSEADGGKRV